MLRIRNARQYHDSLARVEQLQDMRDSDLGTFTQKNMNELLALAEALDAYELAHAEPADYVRQR